MIEHNLPILRTFMPQQRKHAVVPGGRAAFVSLEVEGSSHDRIFGRAASAGQQADFEI